jgi:hypothetical protein
VGADDQDALVFCGNGATTGINIMINKMMITLICKEIQRLKEMEDHG